MAVSRVRRMNGDLCLRYYSCSMLLIGARMMFAISEVWRKCNARATQAISQATATAFCWWQTKIEDIKDDTRRAQVKR